MSVAHYFNVIFDVSKTLYLRWKMTLSITEDIRSITELKRDTSAILQHLHTSGRPVVLTVNGKAEAVIMDAAAYEKTTQALNLLKLLVPAEEDIKEGRVDEAASFFTEFKRGKDL
jgi:prevent-host-death family protein